MSRILHEWVTVYHKKWKGSHRVSEILSQSDYVHSDYFDIVAGELQGDTLVSYLFIICLDYVIRTSIDKLEGNGFKLAKERNRRYPPQTITDADYTDVIALLANAVTQAEGLLHSQERAAAGIYLHVNADKMEYIYFNQRGDISTLNCSSLKLFTYLGSSVSSTETNINTRLAKSGTAIDRLSVIWKSDLTNKIKRSVFKAVVVSKLLYDCTTWTLNKRTEKKLDFEAAPHKSAAVWPPTTHHENYPSSAN